MATFHVFVDWHPACQPYGSTCRLLQARSLDAPTDQVAIDAVLEEMPSSVRSRLGLEVAQIAVLEPCSTSTARRWRQWLGFPRPSTSPVIYR